MLYAYWWHAASVPRAAPCSARWPSQMPRLRDGLFPHQKELLAWMRAREEEFGGGGLPAAVPTHVPLGATGRHVVRDVRDGCAWVAAAPPAPRRWPVHGAAVDWAPRAGATTAVQAFVASTPPRDGAADGGGGLRATTATLVVVNRASVDAWVRTVRSRAPEGAPVLGLRTLRDWAAVSLGQLAAAHCVVVSRGFLEGGTYAHRAGLALERALGAKPASVRDRTTVRCAAARLDARSAPVPLEAMAWPRVVVDDAHRALSRRGAAGAALPEWLRGCARRFTWLVGNGLGHGACVHTLGAGEPLDRADLHALDARLRHRGPAAPPAAVRELNCALTRAEHRLVDERGFCPLYVGTVGDCNRPLYEAAAAVALVRGATEATCAALRHSAQRHDEASRQHLAEAHEHGARVSDAEVALQLQRAIEQEQERARLLAHAEQRERQCGFTEARLRELAGASSARCPICTEEHAVVSFSACGHFTCEECAARLRDRAAGFPQCPECRCHIDEHLVWRIAVGPAPAPRAGPSGSRAAQLVAVLREAPRALVFFPTEELLKLAHLAVSPHVAATRVIGTSAQRARAIAQLLVGDEPVCLFVTASTEHAGLPRCGITDVVLYAPLPPDEARRAVGAAPVLGPGGGARVTMLL